MKKLITLLMIMTMLVALVGCGGSEPDAGGESGNNKKPIELKLANVTVIPSKDAGKFFKEYVETETNGEITVALYDDNVLGDDRVAFESTQFGDIDICVSAPSPLANMFTDFYLFDSPYLFSSSEHVYETVDGEIGQQMFKDIEELGVKGLGYWEMGFRNLTNSSVPARTPEDVKGLTIRTMENDVHLAAWKALGTNPTPMAFTELFTALQQGTVDGQENPLSIIGSNKLYEVQKYISLTEHVYSPHIVFMNLDKFNSLTSEQQEIIEEGMAKATEFQRQECAKYNDTVSEEIIAGGAEIIQVTVDEKKEFQELVLDNGVYDMVKEKMNHPEYIDQILGN